MSMTDEEFYAWFADESTQKVVMLQMRGVNPDTKEEESFLFGTDSGVLQTWASEDITYTPVLGVLSDDIQIDYRVSGRSEITDIVVQNDNGQFDHLLTYDWHGQWVGLSVGSFDLEPINWRMILATKNAGISGVTKDGIRFDLVDPRTSMEAKTPTILTQYDEYVPHVIGAVNNMRPVLADAQTLTYQVHTGPVSSVTVRDNGVVVSHTADYANGKFTLLASPIGQITADVSTGTDTPTTVTIDAILAAGDLFDGTTDTLPDWAIGKVCYEPETWRSILDEVCETVDAEWTVNPSREVVISMHKLPEGEPVDWALTDYDVLQDSVELSSISPRIERVVVRYNRRWHVQGAESMAGSVSPEDVQMYTTEYDVVESVTVQEWEGTGTVLQVDTLLRDKTDAETLLAYLVNKHIKMRFNYRIGVTHLLPSPVFSAYLDTPSLSGGEVVTVPTTELGLSQGDQLRVSRVKVNLKDFSADVELWK